MRLLMFAVLLLSAGPSRVGAQLIELRPAELERYELVRLLAPDVAARAIVGKVVGADSTRLVLLQGRDAEVVIALAQLERIEVLVGKKRAVPAMLGLAAGAFAVGMGVKLYYDARYLNDEWNGVVALFVGAPIGALVGAAVGASIGARDWQAVRLTSIEGSRWERSVGIRLSLRFLQS